MINVDNITDAFKNNNFESIDHAADFPENITPHIVHYVLTQDCSPDEPTQFHVCPPKERPNETRIDCYIAALKGAPSSPSCDQAAAPTPLDIDPGYGLAWPRYCYLILELNSIGNWEYTEGSPGVTMKKKPGEIEDSQLIFVDTNGMPTPLGSKTPPNCKILYWKILKRSDSVAREFNFHISILQKDQTGAVRKLPLIFDPNVPDTGGTTIP
jgi:hypothetical protein